MNPNSPYKPSPLSFGSPRTSPFRRPSSPGSPSNTIRPTTPGSSPGRGHTPVQSPSKLNQSYTAADRDAISENSKPVQTSKFREPPQTPTKSATDAGRASPFLGSPSRHSSPRHRPVNHDALGQLPPAQLREMREAYQVLDRDNDGSVNRDDIADVLLNLGLSVMIRPSLCKLRNALTLGVCRNSRPRLFIFGDCPVLSTRRSSDSQSPHLP
jgi:hypothetical protein